LQPLFSLSSNVPTQTAQKPIKGPIQTPARTPVGGGGMQMPRRDPRNMRELY
jgi:hypothetical protein